MTVIDLTTHCALCGNRHKMPAPDFIWMPARSWCGDADSVSNSVECDDQTDLLCGCWGNRVRPTSTNDTKGKQ